MKTFTWPASDDCKRLINSLANGKRWVIISGAGISTAAGLKDFRSEVGLYRATAMKANNYPTINPIQLLDITALYNTEGMPRLYQLIKDLFTDMSGAQPTQMHHLIRNIHSRGLLLRYYTMNIDGIDDQLGIPKVNLGDSSLTQGGKYVQLHGSIHWLRCSKCSWQEPLTSEWINRLAATDRLIECIHCPGTSRVGRPLNKGHMRTAVLLYGEPHPFDEAVAACFREDISHLPDVILVMGTSLNTTRSSSLVTVITQLAKGAHATPSGLTVFINRDPPPTNFVRLFDCHLLGDLEDWASNIGEELRSCHGCPSTGPAQYSSAQPQQSPEAVKPASCAFPIPPAYQAPSTHRSEGARVCCCIIIFPSPSRGAAEALRACILEQVEGVGLNLRLWLLEWTAAIRLEPAMFGVQEKVSVHIFLLCDSVQSNELSRLTGGLWPPSRKFFEALLAPSMIDLIAASKQSQVVALIDNRYFDQEPRPLHSLNCYVQRGYFKRFVLLEPACESRFPLEACIALARLITRSPDRTSSLNLEQDWFGDHPTRRGFSHLYDLTVLEPNTMPVVLRDANPATNPFGRELNLRSCTCERFQVWGNGRYEIGGQLVIACAACGLQRRIPTPPGTELHGRNGRWYAKITQFYATDGRR